MLKTIFCLFLLFCFAPPLLVSADESVAANEKIMLHGVVQSILLDSVNTLPGEQTKQRQQLVKVKLQNGQTIEAVNNIPEQLSYKLILKKGDHIVLSEENGAIFIEGFYRAHIVLILLSLFVGLVLLVGGKQGFLALASLFFQVALLLFALIPGIKQGLSPILLAAGFSIVATFVTISLVSGWNLKTLAACLGTVGGVVVAGLIGAWAVQASQISGLLEPEMETLHYQYANLKLTELIAAGVIIGALGAAMDVAISIASSLHEVISAAPDKKIADLYQSGMNIGRDVMGTMVNTLILAYAGGSLATIILISQIAPSYLFNMELLVKEIILAIVGSIGLILTIPLTAFLSSYLYVKFKR